MVDNKTPIRPNKEIVDVIRTYLHYNTKTGEIKFAIDYKNRKKGSIADIDKNKYLCVSFYYNKKVLLVASHHIAWFLNKGKWPTHLIDHKDGNGKNNKWSNLRKGDSLKNGANRKTRFDNSSGEKGIYLVEAIRKSGKIYKRWVAEIKVKGKNIRLGYFKTLEEAKYIRDKAEKEYFGEWSYLNR